jgi:hypothetical protein
MPDDDPVPNLNRLATQCNRPSEANSTAPDAAVKPSSSERIATDVERRGGIADQQLLDHTRRTVRGKKRI